MDTRDMKEIESAIEGILFASGEPIHVDRICVALEMDRPTVEQMLQKLMDYYAAASAFCTWRIPGSCVPHRTMQMPSARHLRSENRPS